MTDDADDLSPQEQIMEATFRTLQTHGFSATSISKIAEESGKSKATLYHHYDDKEDLFAHFFEHLVERFESELSKNTSDDPWTRLEMIIDFSLPLNADDEFLQFLRALLEFRLQSMHNSDYAARFETVDELMVEVIGDTIRDGIEAGEFQAVDPERTARFLFTQIHGGQFLALTLQDLELLHKIRKDVTEYVERNVYRTDR